MVIRKVLMVVTCIMPLTVSAVEVSGCTPASGNAAQDQIIAMAKAKGNLSHELGATVSATTNYQSKTVESENSVNTEDTVTDTITLSSKHYVSGVKVIKQGYEMVNGEKQYCVKASMQ